MPLTKPVREITVRYQDGTEETFHSKDWRLAGMRDKSPIPRNSVDEPKKSMLTHSFFVSQEVPGDW